MMGSQSLGYAVVADCLHRCLPCVSAPLCVTCRAMDSTLAELDEEGTCAAAESAEGMRAMTHSTIDMAQSALCVLQTVFGALPEPQQLRAQSGRSFLHSLAGV